MSVPHSFVANSRNDGTIAQTRMLHKEVFIINNKF